MAEFRNLPDPKLLLWGVAIAGALVGVVIGILAVCLAFLIF